MAGDDDPGAKGAATKRADLEEDNAERNKHADRDEAISKAPGAWTEPIIFVGVNLRFELHRFSADSGDFLAERLGDLKGAIHLGGCRGKLI
jgi:hypothetical protein